MLITTQRPIDSEPFEPSQATAFALNNTTVFNSSSEGRSSSIITAGAQSGKRRHKQTYDPGISAQTWKITNFLGAELLGHMHRSRQRHVNDSNQFDLHSPRDFGPNEEALRNLQEETIRRINDAALFVFQCGRVDDSDSRSDDKPTKLLNELYESAYRNSGQRELWGVDMGDINASKARCIQAMLGATVMC